MNIENIEIEKITDSVDQTLDLGKALADILVERKTAFIAMFGDLGTGKTAFVRGFCSRISPTDKIFSPTFAIINEYRGGELPIYHFDVYRITDDDDLYSTGFYEYVDREDGIILCEWSENIPYALPSERIEVYIEKIDPLNFPDKRKITIKEIK